MASKMKREQSWHSVWVILNDAEAISKRKQLGQMQREIRVFFEVWMSSDSRFFQTIEYLVSMIFFSEWKILLKEKELSFPILRYKLFIIYTFLILILNKILLILSCCLELQILSLWLILLEIAKWYFWGQWKLLALVSL